MSWASIGRLAGAHDALTVVVRMVHPLVFGAVVALVVFSVLVSQSQINGMERVAQAERVVVEGAHGLESWLAHPKSQHHEAAAEGVADAGAASHLRGDVVAFLDRLDAMEARAAVFDERATAAPKAAPEEAPSKAPKRDMGKSLEGLEALARRVRAEEAALRRKESEEDGRPKRSASARKRAAAPGRLVCGGEAVEHEVVYWKEVPGDLEYESPITPHHADHDAKYLTFEYDHGGWNNIRMGVECVVVLAHATGRSLVAPPGQNLYLLGAPQVDPKTGKRNRKKLGFSDFFDFGRLRSQGGMHMLNMSQFLAKQQTEAPAAKRPARTDLWGTELWSYLAGAADAQPAYGGSVVAMPRLNSGPAEKKADAETLAKYAGQRKVLAYDAATRDARHVHLPAKGKHRLLNHFYAFGFFGDPEQRSFYRRFIRDNMRYKDEIQCAGAGLVDAIRETSREMGNGGDYYALHIRRGDFQFKEVKISAAEIVENLRGHAIIPEGALLYLATDDPDGVCKGCSYNRKPCPDSADERAATPGCQADPSWDAFARNGWRVVTMRNYTAPLDGVNPNFFGMVDSIVCSRASEFAGTWFSTFTGYIHRLRGYHGLGEHTYYHSTGKVDLARAPKSIGTGYSREYRIGWTDDGGELIR